MLKVSTAGKTPFRAERLLWQVLVEVFRFPPKGGALFAVSRVGSGISQALWAGSASFVYFLEGNKCLSSSQKYCFTRRFHTDCLQTSIPGLCEEMKKHVLISHFL